MKIRISKDSEVPVHEQLVNQIIVLIATGRLEPGDALPSVRTLARLHKVHRNTISRAYQELVYERFLIRQSGEAHASGSDGGTGAANSGPGWPDQSHDPSGS